MTTRFYQFGNLVGGIASNGVPASPAMANYGPVEKFSGTLGDSEITVTFSNSSKHITIINTHDSASLEYSLDGGITWLGISAYGEIKEFASISSLLLRRFVVGTLPTYEVIIILTE